MTRSRILVVVAVASLALAGCVAGSNTMVHTADAQGVIAGFWRGLWHGAIAPLTFVISLFSDTVHVYEVHNNGAWYDFGFLVGLTSYHGGGHAARSRSRRTAAAARMDR